MAHAKKNDKYLQDVHPEDKILVSNVIEILQMQFGGKDRNPNEPSCKKIQNGYEIELCLQPPNEDGDVTLRYDDFVNIWEVSQVKIRDIGVKVCSADRKTYVWVLVLDHKQDLIIEETTIMRIKRKRKLLGIF
jgi:hypothetical protein